MADGGAAHATTALHHHGDQGAHRLAVIPRHGGGHGRQANLPDIGSGRLSKPTGTMASSGHGRQAIRPHCLAPGKLSTVSPHHPKGEVEALLLKPQPPGQGVLPPQLGGGLHQQQVAMGQLQVEGLGGGSRVGTGEGTGGAGPWPQADQPPDPMPESWLAEGKGKSAMNEILFVVEEAEDGSFRANAVGSSIHTEAENLEQLHQEIRDAVHCHFEEGDAPLEIGIVERVWTGWRFG